MALALGAGHKVEGEGGGGVGWAIKIWGWVTIFQRVKRVFSGKIMTFIRGGSWLN